MKFERVRRLLTTNSQTKTVEGLRTGSPRLSYRVACRFTLQVLACFHLILVLGLALDWYTMPHLPTGLVVAEDTMPTCREPLVSLVPCRVWTNETTNSTRLGCMAGIGVVETSMPGLQNERSLSLLILLLTLVTACMVLAWLFLVATRSTDSGCRPDDEGDFDRCCGPHSDPYFQTDVHSIEEAGAAAPLPRAQLPRTEVVEWVRPRTTRPETDESEPEVSLALE